MRPSGGNIKNQRLRFPARTFVYPNLNNLSISAICSVHILLLVPIAQLWGYHFSGRRRWQTVAGECLNICLSASLRCNLAWKYWLCGATKITRFYLRPFLQTTNEDILVDLHALQCLWRIWPSLYCEFVDYNGPKLLRKFDLKSLLVCHRHICAGCAAF